MKCRRMMFPASIWDRFSVFPAQRLRAVEGSQVTIFELRVHREDLGKVIGRQGRTASAIRTPVGAAGISDLRLRFWKIKTV